MACHPLIEAEHLIVCLPTCISIWEVNTITKPTGDFPEKHNFGNLNTQNDSLEALPASFVGTY